VENAQLAQEEILSLRVTGKNRQQAFESSTNQKDELVSKLKSKFEEVVMKYKKLTENAKLLKDHLDDSNKEKETLQIAITTQSAELRALKQQLSQKCQELAVVKAKSQELASVQSVSGERTSELEMVLQQKEEEVKSLTSQLNAVSVSRGNLESEVERLREQLSESSQHAEKSSQLMEERASLQSQMSDLQQQLEELRGTNAALEERFEAKSQELASVQSVSGERTSELEMVLQQKDDQISSLSNELSISSAWGIEISTIKAQLDERNVFIDDLEQRLLAMNDEKEKLAELLQMKKEELEMPSDTQKITHEELDLLRSKAESSSQKDEIIAKLKTKMEEVVSKYKKLSEHAMQLKDQLVSSHEEKEVLTKEKDELIAVNTRRYEELESLKQEMGITKEQNSILTQDLIDHDHARKEILALEAQIEEYKLLQGGHQVQLIAKEEEFNTRINAILTEKNQLQDQKNELVSKVQEKEVEMQEVVDKMKDLLIGYKELQQKHAELQSQHQEQTARHTEELKKFQIEITEANTKIKNFEADQQSNAGMLQEVEDKLQNEIKQLQAQLEVELEVANEARTALELYKKRAQTALKKATTDSKSSIKKIEEETTKLEVQAVEAKVKIESLTQELQASQSALSSIQQANSEQIEKLKEQFNSEKEDLETEWNQRLEELNKQIDELTSALQSMGPLETSLATLQVANDELKKNVCDLKKELESKSEIAREMLRTKDSEIDSLIKQLSAATSKPAQVITSEEQSSSSTRDTTSKRERDLQSTHAKEETETSTGRHSVDEVERVLAAAVGGIFNDESTSENEKPISLSNPSIDTQILNLARVSKKLLVL
jgi:chromosome segregation ATPase